MELDIKTAGSEFYKTVVSLYRTEKYFREKEILANKLLEHSFEAGRLTEEVSLCEDDHTKNLFARRALDELSKTTFALKIMGELFVYPVRRIQPVMETCDKLKELLLSFVNEEIFLQHVELKEQHNNPELPAVNDGGFDDIYTGKL